MAYLRRPPAPLIDARRTPRGPLTAQPASRPSLFGPSAIVGFILTCALGILVYLSSLQLQNPGGQNPAAPAAAPPPAAVLPRTNWSADFPERVEEVTSALSQLALPLPTPAAIAQGAGALRWTHRLYDITLPKPESGKSVEQLFEGLRRAAAGVSVQAVQEPDGTKIQIGIDGLLTHTLTVHWLGHAPRVAIIVDNLGNDLLVARALAGLQAPLTFAVRAGQPFSKEVAELAMMFKQEVLLQLPDDGDRLPGGAAAFPSGKQRADLQRWLDQSLDSVPHAVGISSKPNLLFTTASDHTQWTLDFAKDKHLFIVDAAASPAATRGAATGPAPEWAQSDLMLEEAGDAAALTPQMDTLLQRARTQGDAIAVGHASAALAAGLGAALPAFAAVGVEVVPASVVVADRSLSPH